jgi:hypothetical protein
MPQQITFSAIQMDANFGQADLTAAYNAQVAAIQAQDAILFGSPLMGALNETPLDFYTVDGSAMLDIPASAAPAVAQVLIYGDGVLQCTMDLSDLLVHRIPPFRSKSLELLVRGNINVRSLALATTVQELLGQ